MDKIKKIKRITLLAIVFAVCVVGIIISSFGMYDPVNGDYTIETLENFSEYYSKNEIVKIPNATLVCDENQYLMDHVVVFPDGSTSAGKNIKATLVGKYSVKYYTEVNGEKYSKEYFFEAIATPQSLFESITNCNIYGNIDFTDNKGGLYNGVKITSTAKQDVKFKYNSILNLAESSKTVSFLEFVLLPETTNIAEAANYKIKLTDIYDEENFIEIIVKDGGSLVGEPNVSYISVRSSSMATDGGLVYMYSNNLPITKYASFGTDVRSGFRGTGDQLPIALYYESDTKCIYTTPGSMNNRCLIIDLDDGNMIGDGYVWDGFTTDEVYVSFSVDEVISDTFNLALLKIGKQDLSGKELKEESAPIISLNLGKYSEDTLPIGSVGKKYKVFDAIAYTYADGVLSDPDVVVKYENTNSKLTIKDGYFDTELEGVYHISYSAKGSNGEKTTKILDVNVSSGNYTAIQYSPRYEIGGDENVTTAFVGDSIKIYTPQATGGIGDLQYTIKLIYYDKNNVAEEVVLNENIGYLYATLTNSGRYVLSYSIVDFIASEYSFSREINVGYNTAPIIDEAIVPTAIIVGEKIEFSKANATLYTASERTEVATQILIKDVGATNYVKLENTEFVASQQGEIKLKYIAQSPFDSSIVVESKEYTIKVLDPSLEENFMCGYFYSNGMVKNADKSGIVFTTNQTAIDEGVARIDYARKIIANQFGVAISPVNSENNFSSIKYTLRDVKDIYKVLTLDLKKVNDLVYLYVNGEYRATLPGSLKTESKTPIEISFDNLTGNVMDYNEKVVDKVGVFSSGFVYLTIEMLGVDGRSSIRVNSICNQVMSNSKKDIVSPIISFNEELVSWQNVGLGETFTTPVAYIYDVLSASIEGSLDIVDPDGVSILKTKDISLAHNIKLDKYGRYTVSYVANDKIGGGNNAVRRISLFVVDKVAPTIELQSVVADCIKLDEMIYIPKYTVTDDVDKELEHYIYIIDPKFKHTVIEAGDYQPEVKGRYQLIYYAKDSSGNITLITYEFNVR